MPVELVDSAIELILKRKAQLDVRRASDGSAARLSPSSCARSASSSMVATHVNLLAAELLPFFLNGILMNSFAVLPIGFICIATSASCSLHFWDLDCTLAWT